MISTKTTTPPERAAHEDSQTENWFDSDLVRFFSKVQGDWTSGCWNWLGSQSKDHYSRFWGNGKTVQGHRWIYETFYGRIPAGLVLDHVCVNPSCVAPYHLEPVTPAENLRRRVLRRAEAAAGRPIRIATSATTVEECLIALVLKLPIGGVIVLPGRVGAQPVRSTGPAPFDALTMSRVRRKS